VLCFGSSVTSPPVTTTTVHHHLSSVKFDISVFFFKIGMMMIDQKVGTAYPDGAHDNIGSKPFRQFQHGQQQQQCRPPLLLQQSSY
jgi:hypothetical protein